LKLRFPDKIQVTTELPVTAFDTGEATLRASSSVAGGNCHRATGLHRNITGDSLRAIAARDTQIASGRTASTSVDAHSTTGAFSSISSVKCDSTAGAVGGSAR
jgi:hypothetical protein